MEELRVRSQSQNLFNRALSAAWRNGVQLHEPSQWRLRDPEVEEKMLRDADIRAPFNMRCHMIAGRNWSVVAKSDASPRAPMATSIATSLIKESKHFTSARLKLARAFLSGSRYARIIGSMRKLKIGDGRVRTWWVPTTYQDLDARSYRKVPSRDADDKLSAHWERWDIGAGEWVKESEEDAAHTIRHVYQDDQSTLGYGTALREALGWWWYAKSNVFHDSLQAVERFAQGVMTAKVDGARDAETGMPNKELVDAWVDVLEDMRSRHVLVYDSSDNVEMIKMDGQGWQMMGEIRAELKTTITTLILGANLPTTATEGGSYALGGIQENTTETLIQFDREVLEETLSDDLMGCIWWRNWANMVDLGIAEEMPRFAITQEKREEPKERAEVAAIMHGMGVDISADDIYEKTGFRRPEEGEDVIAGASAPVDGFGMPGSNFQ